MNAVGISLSLPWIPHQVRNDRESVCGMTEKKKNCHAGLDPASRKTMNSLRLVPVIHYFLSQSKKMFSLFTTLL